jgi:hypothetical protein
LKKDHVNLINDFKDFKQQYFAVALLKRFDECRVLEANGALVLELTIPL